MREQPSEADVSLLAVSYCSPPSASLSICLFLALFLHKMSRSIGLWHQRCCCHILNTASQVIGKIPQVLVLKTFLSETSGSALNCCSCVIQVFSEIPTSVVDWNLYLLPIKWNSNEEGRKRRHICWHTLLVWNLFILGELLPSHKYDLVVSASFLSISICHYAQCWLSKHRLSQGAKIMRAVSGEWWDMVTWQSSRDQVCVAMEKPIENLEWMYCVISLGESDLNLIVMLLWRYYREKPMAFSATRPIGLLVDLTSCQKVAESIVLPQ